MNSFNVSSSSVNSSASNDLFASGAAAAAAAQETPESVVTLFESMSLTTSRQPAVGLHVSSVYPLSTDSIHTMSTENSSSFNSSPELWDAPCPSGAESVFAELNSINVILNTRDVSGNRKRDTKSYFIVIDGDHLSWKEMKDSAPSKKEVTRALDYIFDRVTEGMKRGVYRVNDLEHESQKSISLDRMVEKVVKREWCQKVLAESPKHQNKLISFYVKNSFNSSQVDA